MAYRDYKKIERIMKDFSQNVGGSENQDFVFGKLTPVSQEESYIFNCSISNDDLYKIVSEDKKIAILSFPDDSGNTGYGAVYGGVILENPDKPYSFYVETLTNYFVRQEVLMWSILDQKFKIDGGN